MNTQLQKIFDQLKTERLSERERTHLRERVLLRARGYRATYREFSFQNLFVYISKHTVSVGLLVLCVLGGSISYAAEGALPGDALYRIKVGINEPLRETFAFSDTKKAEVEVMLAERRLFEVTELASIGTLTPEVKDTLLKEVTSRATRFSQTVSATESRVDPAYVAELSSNFEGALEAHTKLHRPAVLSMRAVTLTATPSDSASGEDELEQATRAVSSVRFKVEAKIQEGPQALLKKTSEHTLRAAEAEYKKARKALETRKGNFSADTISTAEESLQNTRAELDEGKANVDAGRYQGAVPQFLGAERSAYGVRIMLNASLRAENVEEGNSSGGD